MLESTRLNDELCPVVRCIEELVAEPLVLHLQPAQQQLLVSTPYTANTEFASAEVGRDERNVGRNPGGKEKLRSYRDNSRRAFVHVRKVHVVYVRRVLPHCSLLNVNYVLYVTRLEK